jgi:hypothetical protein
MDESPARLLGTKNEFVDLRIVEDHEAELTVSLNVRAGIFAAYHEVQLPVHMIVEFRDGLAGIVDAGKGSAELVDDEGVMSLEVSILAGQDLSDSPFPPRVIAKMAQPSLHLHGELRDEHGNELTYGFRLNPKALPTATAALDAALRSL